MAGGAGSTYSALLKNIAAGLQSAGQTVTIHDVAPLTADDPNGTSLAALGLPLAFGGMISAVLLSTLLRNRPTHRILGAIVAAAVIGLVVTAILQFGFNSIDGNYFLTSAALAFGMAAISLFVLGCHSRLGFPGLGLGGLTMMFVSNPLSGMATGWQWLPSPWGTIGQLLPIGASGTLIRSAAFFDGNGGLRPVIVLTCWAAIGILLAVQGQAKKRMARLSASNQPAPAVGSQLVHGK